MTAALDEFTEWRDSVEARLGKLETVSDEHAGKIRHDEHLLGSMDEDLSKIQVEFRAQRGMLQALHLTQNEHTRALGKLEVGVQGLNTRVQGLDTRVHGLDARVQGLDTRVQGLEEGMQKVQAGVQVIIGLLDRNLERGDE
jgi:chromosome segregation ATPase